MTLSIGAKRVGVAALSLAMLAPVFAPFTPSAQARTSVLADPALEQVWDRTDKPIEDRVAARSWTWGPESFYSNYEPYAEGLGGQHLVTYFDKSRMEINNPLGDRNAQWFVTNGLLVVELISGNIQTGDNRFSQAVPAAQPVAGDANGSPDTPTYASLARVASLKGDKRAADRTGRPVSEGLGRTGGVATLSNLSGYARYATYEPTTGHNIPDVFWSFLNKRGIVYHNGRYENDTVVDWLFAMGYPITEPYWIKIRVGGQDRWVLMQAFQRRILTFSPQNPAGWQVEMGNVGRAYYDWRYNSSAPTPTPTPVVTPGISINPTSGDGRAITITGKGFPASLPVTLGIEKPGANYYQALGTATARPDGTFATKVSLPAASAKLGEVTITATANAGTVRATQAYHFSFEPAVSLNTAEVLNNGTLRVEGDGFPSLTAVKLGALFNGRDMQWLANTTTGEAGDFTASMPVGNRAIGATFQVVALADGGYKATSSTVVRVVAKPGLQVMPAEGPAGQNVALYGYAWPPNRAVTLGLRVGQGESWLANPAYTDGVGNFSAQIFVGPEYTGKGNVYLVAFDSAALVRVEALYRVTGAPVPTVTPAPLQPSVSVNPNVLAIGQVATVTGANWQVGGTISIGVGRPGYGVEEWLATATGDAARFFSANITLGPRWQDAGQLVLTALIPNLKSATTTIQVVGRRVAPSGLPLTVTSYTHLGSTQYKLNAEGWQPGNPVAISVVSADGSVNVPVTTATVGAGGKFGATFQASAQWAGRADLGVLATTSNGDEYSLRYLPLTGMVKTNTTNNTYTITGFNWPANARIQLQVYGQEDSKDQTSVTRTLSADANGYFTFTIDLPRIPGSPKNDVELHAIDSDYTATFDL